MNHPGLEASRQAWSRRCRLAFQKGARAGTQAAMSAYRIASDELASMAGFKAVAYSGWRIFACLAILLASMDSSRAQEPAISLDRTTEALHARFDLDVAPFLQRHCVSCHNEQDRESGVRVDHLNAALEDSSLGLWEAIRKQVHDRKMPPEEGSQPNEEEHRALIAWIDQGLHFARSRPVARNGLIRRLTVPQYDATLKQLLDIEDNLTDILPPDAVSKDGFTNNASTLQLSPLQLEAYFQIAERALACAVVDEESPPVIQHFRMQLGQAINGDPCPDALVLGANNHLLANSDFIVTEPELHKPFRFRPYSMQRRFRFIEGYQGNDTVRAWRDFDSIYHAVFACMRGSEGYPKGRAYETVPEGLLLRPAIPSPEIFGESSTYGPHANFKISLRELPDRGRFRVKVRAAKLRDGLILDRNSPTLPSDVPADVSIEGDFRAPQTWSHVEPGVYQVELHREGPRKSDVLPDATQLESELAGYWPLDISFVGQGVTGRLNTEPSKEVQRVVTPFGQGMLLDGSQAYAVVEHSESLRVGRGDFTVAAWIKPHELRQAGIVAFGSYNYTPGWILDMPNEKGILRLETANAAAQHNGSLLSGEAILRTHQWQHVAAVVQRGEGKSRLYVNGYQVSEGTIGDGDLSNPNLQLHIGRVPGFQLFLGEIDEVRLYRRALGVAEIEALVQPGREWISPPVSASSDEVELTLHQPSYGQVRFTHVLRNSPFVAVRLDGGPLRVQVNTKSTAGIARMDLRRVPDGSELAARFSAFEAREPKLGVHLGLRRDCGSTLGPVGPPQSVATKHISEYCFEGAISNIPSPDVEKDNVNYLAGIREIGIRSEYTDGRDMPRLLIESVEFEGPIYDQWPPTSHRNIFPDAWKTREPEAVAREILESFATRAFRRPVSSSELERLLQLWKDDYQASQDFQKSALDVLLVVLTSPQFLFLIESSHGPEAEPISDWELASKLSFFLWNGPPDEELLRLAGQGRLKEELDRQLERMMADKRFAHFAQSFASQWMSLDKFDVVETDAKRFAGLTRGTKSELRKEPSHFVAHLIQNNLPVANLIRSDFVLANEVVAKYYGLADACESGFEFVAMPRRDRMLGGVLTHAAVLSGLSDGREANPVKRGAWFARRIIAEPPDDPPPNVPKLEDLTDLSLRERLRRHRDVPGCIQCHTGIDPWGLPFEQFDAGGLAKTEPVDCGADLPDGTQVGDFEALRTYLCETRIDSVAFSFAKHLAVYAIGRSLTYNEARWLKESSLELRSSGYRSQDILRWLVHSDLFLKK